ncbi:hypothetical protein Asppvi_000714 [Aspergillus pseudoviridinutans]|uniref:Uncharacterized protein n=1 Tax=Aspergillus pseudoviridinutans TaxID=1517512 RepID=A0A9P3EQN1_9EURO|nr:uncharacterized protein Asppvi_000714 [Aspergillus pseudoviridinutans]GIJ82208.1 hypothetical protein Asppvi_000714 [Aspergillus pseudoviridinutans]
MALSGLARLLLFLAGAGLHNLVGGEPYSMSSSRPDDTIWADVSPAGPEWACLAKTNDTTAAASAPAPTADQPAPATNKRRLCHICGKSHTGDCWPLCGTCGRRHPGEKPCRTATRRQPARRQPAAHQPPTVVANYTCNSDGHAITISAQPTSAPPPAKKQKRRKRPNKAKKKVEEKKEEEKEKDVEPAQEGEKPSSE